MSKLKATVVIPMYNAERTINKTLNALKRQTEKNFEVIIINDGSTDKSVEIIKNFKADFPLRLINQKNSGPASARNKGIKNAKSDIVIFLDSDCVPKNSFIKNILKPFKDDRVMGVQGEYETKNKNFLIARYVGYEIYYRHERMKKNKKVDHVASYACAYRRGVLSKGFSEKFKKADMEDIELSYRIAKKKKILLFEPSAVVKHTHPDGLLRFMRQQFSRGYWSSLKHAEHPEKLIKDSYFKYDTVIQGLLVSLLFLSIFLYIISLISNFYFSIFIPLTMLILLYISNLSFGVYCSKYENVMLFLGPLIASCRSVCGTFGFLYGTFYFKFLKRKNFKYRDKVKRK